MKSNNFLKAIVCALGAAALGAFLPTPAAAGPVCVDPERGIGGTGAVAQGAVGGTGAVAGAIGGTGAIAGSIGGTGAPQGAIGGTGAVAGAIGGTGSKTNGGIGGTGDLAKGIGGTGIVGTITGFASVCVNGLEVHYDVATPVTANGMASAADRLAVGQVVAIEAGPSARGLEARRISVLHAVAGPVTEVRAGEGVIRVMGQKVRLGSDTRIAGQAIASLRAGDTVQVSGLRNRQGEIEASRVQAVAELAEHSVIGPLQRGGRDDLAVDDTLIHGVGSGLRDGTEALVRGRWTGERMDGTAIQGDPARSAIGAADRVVIEGLVRSESGELRVGEFPLSLSSDTRYAGGNDLRTDQRVRISGRLDRDGRVRVDRVEVERREASTSRRGGEDARGSGSSGDDARGEDRDRSGRGGGDRSDRDARDERGSGGDRGERPERAERPERPEKPERPERPERPEKPEKPERPERPSSGKQ